MSNNLYQSPESQLEVTESALTITHQSERLMLKTRVPVIIASVMLMLFGIVGFLLSMSMALNVLSAFAGASDMYIGMGIVAATIVVSLGLFWSGYFFFRYGTLLNQSLMELDESLFEKALKFQRKGWMIQCILMIVFLIAVFLFSSAAAIGLLELLA